MILGICDNVTTLKVIQIVRTVITIIKIVVPLILIISGMITFIRAVKDGETSQALNRFYKKCIAAILIFLIPTFVNIIANTISDDTVELTKCIQNSTPEKISEVESQQAKTYIDKAKETLLESDYIVAQNVINNIKNQTKKNELNEEIKIIGNYIELKKQIIDLSNNYDASKATSLFTKINAITDETVKEKLLKMLEEAGIGKPLNVTPGTYLKNYNGMRYYIIIPEGATTKMPIITYFVGGSPSNTFSNADSAIMKSHPTKDVLNGIAYKYQKFIYIYPDYKVNTHSSFKQAKELIDSVCNEFSCDQSKKIITGVSNGAVITFWLGYTYPNTFSAIVPMCGPAYDYQGALPTDLSKAGSYVGTSLWTLTAGRGDFGNYEYKSKQLIKKIHQLNSNSKALYACKTDEFKQVIKSELGRDPTNMPSISIYKHCTIMAYYQVPEFWEWMLKQ
ncbi:MAG: hypothetical protein IKR57_00510 [Bacilli bacterium]|nr:hypothetical protein [Bacilli bacterium]